MWGEGVVGVRRRTSQEAAGGSLLTSMLKYNPHSLKSKFDGMVYALQPRP